MHLARYRPYVVLIVAVLVVLLLPSTGNDRTTGRTSAPAASGRSSGNGALPATQVAAGAGGAGGPTVGAAPSLSVTPRGRRGSATAAPAGSSASANAATAGIGTAAALSAPDCDAARQRIKVAFVYAPPCVVPWPKGGDNGGATGSGVTADTITVVVFNPAGAQNTTSDADLLAQVQRAAEPFEHFYRLWGRTVQYKVFHSTGGDEVAQRADAVKIADLKPFLALNVYTDYPILIEELAKRHIVVTTSFISAKKASELAPYLWGWVLHPDEVVAINAAAYAGKRLVGKPARWAGQAEFQTRPRKFALIYPDTWDPSVFEREFARYGGSLADKIDYKFGVAANGSTYTERSRTIVARLKEKGITTVIAGADLVILIPVTKEATNQQWFPEWVLTGFAGQDLDIFGRVFDQLQWQHAFGSGALPAGSSLGTAPAQFYRWYWNEAPAGMGPDWVWSMYTAFHGAGPHLTPETYRDGVFAMPPAGGFADGRVLSAEMSYGRWGFFPFDDYNAYDDFTEIWWDATGRGRDNAAGTEGVGVYRYVDGGKRFRPQEWPTTDPKAFDPNGVAPYYTDYPPADRPPSYPCTGCPSAGG